MVYESEDQKSVFNAPLSLDPQQLQQLVNQLLTQDEKAVADLSIPLKESQSLLKQAEDEEQLCLRRKEKWEESCKDAKTTPATAESKRNDYQTTLGEAEDKSNKNSNDVFLMLDKGYADEAMQKATEEIEGLERDIKTSKELVEQYTEKLKQATEEVKAAKDVVNKLTQTEHRARNQVQHLLSLKLR